MREGARVTRIVIRRSAAYPASDASTCAVGISSLSIFFYGGISTLDQCYHKAAQFLAAWRISYFLNQLLEDVVLAGKTG